MIKAIHIPRSHNLQHARTKEASRAPEAAPLALVEAAEEASPSTDASPIAGPTSRSAREAYARHTGAAVVQHLAHQLRRQVVNGARPARPEARAPRGLPRATAPTLSPAEQQLLFLLLRALGVLSPRCGTDRAVRHQHRSPRRVANVAVRQERARTEQEKYAFSPEDRQKIYQLNRERQAHNMKIDSEVSKIDRQMASLCRGSSKSDEGKFIALAKKRAKLLMTKKPHVDLVAVTHRVDQIVSDPKLSSGQKQKKIERLRKEYDLPESDMKSLFTKRLSKVYASSKKRLEAKKKAHATQLTKQLTRAEQTYGKQSPEAVALRAEIGRVDKIYSREIADVDGKSKTLDKMYPSFWDKVGDFFKSVGKFFGKILDFVMPIVKLIPGVGQIAGAIYGGVKALGRLVTGDFKGALLGLIDAIPGAGVISGVAGTVISAAKTAVTAIGAGVSTVTNLVKGNLGAALGSIGSALGASGLGGVVQKAIQGGVNMVGGAFKGVFEVGKKVVGTAGAVIGAGKNLLNGTVRGAVQGIRGFGGIFSRLLGNS